MMCLQPSKHTVLPCHLCLLLPCPVQNFPVPYLLSPAVCKTEEADLHILVHSLLAAHTWLAGYPSLVFLPSLFIAPRALSWLTGTALVVGKADVSWCLQNMCCQCVQWLPLPLLNWMSVQNMNWRVTDCWHRYWILNQSQIPCFSKSGWITLLHVSPALHKWWGNLISLQFGLTESSVCSRGWVCVSNEISRDWRTRQSRLSTIICLTAYSTFPLHLSHLSVCWVM